MLCILTSAGQTSNSWYGNRFPVEPLRVDSGGSVETTQVETSGQSVDNSDTTARQVAKHGATPSLRGCCGLFYQPFRKLNRGRARGGAACGLLSSYCKAGPSITRHRSENDKGRPSYKFSKASAWIHRPAQRFSQENERLNRHTFSQKSGPSAKQHVQIAQYSKVV